MSKATRIRQQNAREKIAAQRAAERRAEQRRRMFITGGSVLAVIAIVVAFIVVKSMNSPTTTPSSAARTPLPASVTKNITSVPASALATVGKGSVLTFNPGETAKPVTVAVVGDTAMEPNETFFVNLSSPVNASIADALGQGSILNDD